MISSLEDLEFHLLVAEGLKLLWYIEVNRTVGVGSEIETRTKSQASTTEIPFVNCDGPF